jgi:tetratricopeptide (TPR) repeat protein
MNQLTHAPVGCRVCVRVASTGVSNLRRNTPFFPLETLALLVGLFSFAHPDVLEAQRIAVPVLLPDNTNPAFTGLINVRVQQDTGSPFATPATVTLRSADMQINLTSRTNESGLTAFNSIPSGQYLVEISASGYRTVREQIGIGAGVQVQDLLVAMIPETGVTLSGAPSGGGTVNPKAIKETEKGLRSLQVGKLDEAQQHLTRALAAAPNFADGNYLMGVLLLRRKESAKARPYLQKAVDIAPNHAPALLALGEAEYLQRDFARATESLEQSLREQPRSPQASTAQQLIDRMRAPNQPRADAAAAATQSSGAVVAELELATDANQPGLVELSALPALTPVTETNWAPPDVDQERVVLDASTACQLDEVVQAAAGRVKELMQNVDRFTATEKVEHSNLSPLGLQISSETRKFNYLVEIRQLQSHLDVQEYRNGSVSVQDFPAHIGTIGLPTLALVFHPYYQEKYEYSCEVLGSWRDKPAWVVHFQQRTDRNSETLVYRVGGKSFPVRLKGRAWIDVQSSQIVAMESDLIRPIPEIRLLRDHQLIEYGPVAFRNNTMQLWLPKSADWYCSLSGQRYHRRHSFSQFLLFSVDDSQKITKPKEPIEPVEPPPTQQ